MIKTVSRQMEVMRIPTVMKVQMKGIAFDSLNSSVLSGRMFIFISDLLDKKTKTIEVLNVKCNDSNKILEVPTESFVVLDEIVAIDTKWGH